MNRLILGLVALGGITLSLVGPLHAESVAVAEADEAKTFESKASDLMAAMPPGIAKIARSVKEGKKERRFAKCPKEIEAVLRQYSKVNRVLMDTTMLPDASVLKQVISYNRAAAALGKNPPEKRFCEIKVLTAFTGAQRLSVLFGEKQKAFVEILSGKTPNKKDKKGKGKKAAGGVKDKDQQVSIAIPKS